MANSTKDASSLDSSQTLQGAFNDNDSSFVTSGFITAKVGHKITRTVVSPTIDDMRYFDIVVTRTSTTTNTSAVISGLAKTEDLAVGQYVFGTGIPTNTTISSIDSSSQVTLSAVATASGTVSLQYANSLMTLRITYDGTRTNVDVIERTA